MAFLRGRTWRCWARGRAAAGVLFRDLAGRVLLVDQAHKDTRDLHPARLQPRSPRTPPEVAEERALDLPPGRADPAWRARPSPRPTRVLAVERAEVRMPVRRFALGWIGGDLVQVDVERDAIEAGLTACCQGDAGLLGEQPGAGVEVPARQEAPGRRVAAGYDSPASVVRPRRGPTARTCQLFAIAAENVPSRLRTCRSNSPACAPSRKQAHWCGV